MYTLMRRAAESFDFGEGGMSHAFLLEHGVTSNESQELSQCIATACREWCKAREAPVASELVPVDYGKAGKRRRRKKYRGSSEGW